MKSKVAAFLAMSIIVAPGAVMSKTISKDRLSSFLADASADRVSLEGLRARDRELLEALAEALQSRYGELIEGAEIVFARVREGGILHYRIDFVGLKNESHATAICEILDLDRCMAIGEAGEMRILSIGRTLSGAVTVGATQVPSSAPFKTSDGLDEMELRALLRGPSSNVRKNPAPETAPLPLRRGETRLATVREDRSDKAETAASGQPGAEPPPALVIDEYFEITPSEVASAPIAAQSKDQDPGEDAASKLKGETELSAASMADENEFPDHGDPLKAEVDVEQACAHSDDISATEGDAAAPDACDDPAISPAKPAVLDEVRIMPADVLQEPSRPIEVESPAMTPEDPTSPREIELAPAAAAQDPISPVEMDEIEGGDEPSVMIQSALPAEGLPWGIDVADLSGSMDVLSQLGGWVKDAQSIDIRKVREGKWLPEQDEARPPVAQVEATAEEAIEGGDAAIMVSLPGVGDVKIDGGTFTTSERASIPSAPPRLPDAFAVAFNRGKIRLKIGQRIGVARLSEAPLDDQFFVPMALGEGGSRRRLQKMPIARPAAPGASTMVASLESGAPLGDPGADASVIALASALGIEGGEGADLSRIQLAQVPSIFSPQKEEGGSEGLQRAPTPSASGALEELLAGPSAAPKPAPAPMAFAAPAPAEEPQNLFAETGAKTPVEAGAPNVFAAPEKAPPAESAVDLLRQIAEAARSEAGSGYAFDRLAVAAGDKAEATATPELRFAEPTPDASRAHVRKSQDRAGTGQGLMERSASSAGAHVDGASNPDLRMELSYVVKREDVSGRVSDLKSFFPEVMLRKGRFFGASIPSAPGVFIVGIEAHDAKSRDDLVWYMDRMEIPYAFRR
jgi:hypothetical protein